MLPSQITQWCSHFITKQIKPGDLCIDATMGNGRDTLLLSRLAGPNGRVLAFDVQETALKNTQKRLEKEQAPKNCTLLLDSHVHMNLYAQPGTVSCITFNFGYLPGGDHSKATQPQSSVTAIEKGLALLKKEGLMSLCIYSGGDTGFSERDAILTYIRSLDPKQYLVIQCDYVNRPNHPPIPVLIFRL